MASFAKVDVKEIESDLPRSNFSEAEIEQLADLILAGGGILRPLILKQIDIEKYKVLDGHLEYFACVKAREKDPRQAETTNAFVVVSKEEAVIQKQVELLRNVGQPAAKVDRQPLDVPVALDQSNSQWISSFETRLSEMREVLFQTKREHEYRFTQLEKNFQEKQQTDLLDLLNTSKKQELIDELSRYGIASAKIEAIYNARNQKEHKKFTNYQDVVKAVKGLGAAGMLNLIDAWARAHTGK
jgi:hypothetical protein